MEITIASKGLKNIPESAIKLEHDKKIDSLEVRVWHKHQRYLKEIKLGLIYNGSE